MELLSPLVLQRVVLFGLCAFVLGGFFGLVLVWCAYFSLWVVLLGPGFGPWSFKVLLPLLSPFGALTCGDVFYLLWRRSYSWLCIFPPVLVFSFGRS